MTATTLSEHLSTLPDALRRTLDTPLPALPDAGPVVFTGIGASGAVARHAAHVWQHAFDLDARALPISSLLEGPARDDVTWIVLSQGLSPNASLALRAVTAESDGASTGRASARGSARLRKPRAAGGLYEAF